MLYLNKGQWNQEGPVGGGEYTTTQVTIPKDVSGTVLCVERFSP